MNVTAAALSAALVHSIWQDTLVALLLWSALVVLRHRSANARYVACCAALALMATLPVVTTVVLSERGLPVYSSTAAAVVAAPLDAGDTLRSAPSSPASEVRGMDWMASLTPWLLPVWLVGVGVCSLRLLLASLHTVALKRRSDPESGPIASTVATLAARIGVGRPVSVRISMMTDSPATFGFLRPVILLPPAVALGVTPQQLEALLAHELAHIRRHDYLVNVLQMLAETLFFYHPAVWWVSKRMRIERELCCDDIAVSACGDAVSYAQALTRVARLMVGQPGMAIGAGGGVLPLRIQRLLGMNAARSPLSPLWVTAASLVMIVGVMFMSPYAQSAVPGTLAPASTEQGSVLRGRITDGASGKPVPGAMVRAQFITGTENPTTCPIGDCEGDTGGRFPTYRTTAGDDGRFTIPNVKPGDYLVAAVADGYVQRYFGQTSDDMPEMSVNVGVNETSPSIDVRLMAGGSVSGRVLSDKGEGLPGVEVELLRRTYIPGGSRPLAVAFAQTEDKGTFYFRNVTPGEYYVHAYTSARPARDSSLSYVGTFYLDATAVAFAQPVVVGGGQEVSGVELALATAKTRTLSGRLVDPAGGPLTTATVSLMPHSSGTLEVLKSAVAADGRFHFRDVPAADYMLTVFDSSDRRSWNTVVRDISVLDDVTDLVLVSGPSVYIDGRVTRDEGQPLPFDATDLQFMTEQRTSELGTHGAGFGKVSADGTFSMRSGAGTMSLRVGGLPPRWFVKSVQLDGVDVTDAAFDLTPGGPRRLEVTLTNRVSRLSGTVTDRSARPVAQALVIVFPEDRARWNNARAIRTTFSHQQGRYEIGDLPISGYRVVAVTSLPRNAWTDPEVLARLSPSASPVSLDDLGQGTLHLRVVSPPADLIQ